MNSSGFVTWVPPFTLDGVPIDGYNLEVSNGLHTHVINNFPNTSINLAEHGVQCGMLYNVTVTAINSVGTGASHHTTGDFGMCMIYIIVHALPHMYMYIFMCLYVHVHCKCIFTNFSRSVS